MSSPTQTPQAPPPMPPRYYVRRRSIAGPIVLIALGVLFLLGNMHVLTWHRLGYYFARFWPVLIILWGIIKLYEHWSDTRRGLPGRGLGAGGVLLMIFLIIFGLSTSAAYRVNWNAFSNDMDFNGDFGSLFGNTYTFTQTLEQPFNPGESLRVVDDRGDVTINTWDDPKIKVVVNKRIIAENDNDSRDIDSKTQASIGGAAPLIVLDANTHGGGNRPVESNLQIWMPKKAAVEVSSGRGDIRVATRDGDVHVTDNRGDTTFDAITGNVTATVRNGSVRAQNIQGDVNIDGRLDDTTVSDVSGKVSMSGEFFGEMNLARIAKGVTFHSSRTDMEMTALPGDLALQSGDLRARAVGGPLRLITRSKDIHIENVTGDLKIENTNGLVEYSAGNKLGAVDITNSRGDVQVNLPPQAAFQLDADARRGDIQSDFEGIAVSEQRNDHTAKGVVGKGGPTIRISNSGGDISLRKGSASTQEAAAPHSLPPDSSIVPGGGLEKSQPPKAPKAPRPPKKGPE